MDWNQPSGTSKYLKSMALKAQCLRTLKNPAQATTGKFILQKPQERLDTTFSQATWKKQKHTIKFAAKMRPKKTPGPPP